MEPDVMAELNRIGLDDWFEIQGYEAKELRDFILEKDAEIERLREALQKIIDYDWRWEGGGKLGKIEGFCAKIARSALQQKGRE